jgi:hypothetical protein
MIHVGQQVSGAAGFDAEVGATCAQCPVDAMQNAPRIYLVVDRIEGGDEVEALVLSKGSGVANFKAGIPQTARRSL